MVAFGYRINPQKAKTRQEAKVVGGDNNHTPVKNQVPDIYRFVGCL